MCQWVAARQRGHGDPELGVFGSQEKRRRIIAGESQKNRIVAILVLLLLGKQKYLIFSIYINNYESFR